MVHKGLLIMYDLRTEVLRSRQRSKGWIFERELLCEPKHLCTRYCEEYRRVSWCSYCIYNCNIIVMIYGMYAMREE